MTIFNSALNRSPPTEAEQQRRLKFRPAIEAEIYSTVPHRLVSYLRLHPPGGPIAFIGGTHSMEINLVGMKATQRITQNRVSWMEGSHLFPFERPDETVKEVLRWIDRLETIAAQ